MEDTIIIAVNKECAGLFMDFASNNNDDFLLVNHKSFIGSSEAVEFIVTVTPHILTALAAYLVARIQNSKHSIKIKKGDMEIELNNVDITPEVAMNLLCQLEQKTIKNE